MQVLLKMTVGYGNLNKDILVILVFFSNHVKVKVVCIHK